VPRPRDLAWRWLLGHTAALSIGSLLLLGFLEAAPDGSPSALLFSLAFGLPVAWIQASALGAKRLGWILATCLGLWLGLYAAAGFQASLGASSTVSTPFRVSPWVGWTMFVLRRLTPGIVLGLAQGTALRLTRSGTGAPRWGFWTAAAWGSASLLHRFLQSDVAYAGPMYDVSDAFRGFVLALPQGALYGLLLLPALKKDPASAS
jgi:hypothetical protein